MIAPRGPEAREPARISPTVLGLDPTVGSLLNRQEVLARMIRGSHEGRQRRTLTERQQE